MSLNKMLAFFFLLQNYNKSRIHSARGVRHVVVSLDDSAIFQGEIARASGDTRSGPSSLGDVSLYNHLFPTCPPFHTFRGGDLMDCSSGLT